LQLAPGILREQGLGVFTFAEVLAGAVAALSSGIGTLGVAAAGSP